MKVKDPHFILEKIRKYLDEDIKPTRHREVIALENWKYYETHMDNRINDAYKVTYDDTQWTDFKLWDTWGGYDKVAWFRSDVTVPSHWAESPVVLRVLVGPRDGGDSTAETLLYVNEKPIQGIDIWHEEAYLDPNLYKDNLTMQVSLKAWSGVLVPPKFRTFKIAELIKIDPYVDKFYFVIDTLLKCVVLLEENDLRRIKLVKLLNQTIKKVNFLNYKEETYYDSVKDALEFIQEKLSELEKYEEIKPLVTGIGHSHIDMAWLWRLCATREKASRTFATVLNLMRQYPEYRYLHTSPQLYKFLEQDYPEIFASIKQKIDEGQWEITGGMWVEPDTNIPSGEALVRQFLHGVNYIKETFNKDSKVAWLPDVFGYSAALPQIMKKSGMESFMTTKISWNQYNHFPFDTFNWKGLDGSEILTHFITTPEDGSWFYTYNGPMEPEDITGIWHNYRDKDKNEELLISFGWGDGGGGPTRDMLERARVMKNLPGIPKVQIDTVENYFERLRNNVDREAIGTWDGELYFEYHRGTYTSQGFVKRENRKAENLLHNIEFMCALADVLKEEDKYPQDKINEIWENILLNQFHDILPGSSIREVYEDCKKDYKWIQESGQNILDEATIRINEHIKVKEDSLLIYNTLGWVRNDIICIPYDEKVIRQTTFKDEIGTLCNAQHTDEGVYIFVKEIPAYGYKTIQMINEKSPVQRMYVNVTEDLLESRFYRIVINEKGEIASLYDKVNDVEIATDKPMNLLRAFEDKPLRFDAWDIDVFYKEKPHEMPTLVSKEVIESGSLRGVLRLKWRFNKSTIEQDMIIYHDIERIDFKTHVHWEEKQVLLKAFFPVNIHASTATYEIQFGNIERPTHSNNEWDFAKFEVPAHKWVDLSQGNYGISLLNDCKYGHDIHENIIGLTLIKSPIKPDETADRGEHYFTYALYPHKGRWQEGNVQYLATQMNIPIVANTLSGSMTGQDFANFSLVTVNSDHIILDTIKRAEKEHAYIVRLYEFKNMNAQGIELKFNIPVKKVVETNLVEHELQEVELIDNQICFDMGCYEIKTYKVYF